MKFSKKIAIMRESYYELERNFIEISRIIPFENQGTTYSPRLYDILQSACGQVENLMRMICDELKITYSKNPDFPEYYNKLNQTKILEIQFLDYFPKNYICAPFELKKGENSPFWWRAYNQTKHNLPEGYKEGNLKNTIHSLSAVYSLHCIAIYCTYGGTKILQRSDWKDMEGIGLKTMQPTIELEWDDNDVRPRSSIFVPVVFYEPVGDLNKKYFP